mmetsp:Transcript_35274/g.105370  ORF Transcript_35274/g.105370 Transcript_35274/m.105370 type:complete len:148 (+) Transcript_35274:322-765(+)
MSAPKIVQGSNLLFRNEYPLSIRPHLFRELANNGSSNNGRDRDGSAENSNCQCLRRNLKHGVIRHKNNSGSRSRQRCPRSSLKGARADLDKGAEKRKRRGSEFHDLREKGEEFRASRLHKDQHILILSGKGKKGLKLCERDSRLLRL